MKMKFYLAVMIAVSAIMSSTISICSAEDVYIVKVYGTMGGYEYKAMTRSEFADLVREIKKENTQFSRAQRLAEAEWNKQKNSGLHTGRYAGHSLHQRKAMKGKSYKTREAAEAYIEKKADSAARSEERKLEREEESMRKKTRGRGGSKKRKTIEKRKMQKEESAAKRQEKLEKSYELFSKHLNALTHPVATDSDEKTAEKEPEKKAGH